MVRVGIKAERLRAGNLRNPHSGSHADQEFMKGNPFSSFCVPCAERGRPKIPAVHEVGGEGFCHNCFKGGNGPSSPQNYPFKANRLAVRTQRMIGIAADYNEGLRIVDICLKHRCRPAMVIEAAKNARLMLRSMKTAAANDRNLVRDYLVGQSYRALSHRHGIPVGSILYRLHRAGIEPNRNEHA